MLQVLLPFLANTLASETAAPVLTAYQINTNVTGAEDCVASGTVGTFVSVNGYITALDTYGFYMQDDVVAAAHTGIYVYLATEEHASYDPTWASARVVGERVLVSALVDEYYGLSELNLRTSTDPSIVSVSTGNALTPLVTTTGGIGEACNAGGEAHEGILVTVTGVTIESVPNSFGEITINDGSRPLLSPKSFTSFLPPSSTCPLPHTLFLIPCYLPPFLLSLLLSVSSPLSLSSQAIPFHQTLPPPPPPPPPLPPPDSRR